MSKLRFTEKRGNDADAGYPAPQNAPRPRAGELRGDAGGTNLGSDPDHPRRTKTGLHGADATTETLRYGSEESEPEAYDEDQSHPEDEGNANTAQFGRDSETDDWHRSSSHPALGRRSAGAPESAHSSHAELVDRGEGYRGKGRGLLP